MKKIIPIMVCILVIGCVGLIACGGEGEEAEGTTTPPPTTEKQEATPTQETEKTPGAITDAEPNDSPAQATEIHMEMMDGTLTEGDADWYQINVPNEHILSLDFTPDDEATAMCLGFYDQNMDELEWIDSVDPGVTESITRLMNHSSGGTYYAAIKFGSGSYTFEVTSESQNDAGSGGDAGDDYPSALEAQTGTSFSGLIGEFDEQDWYGIEVPNEHILSLDFTPDDEATAMCLGFYDQDTDELEWIDSVDPGVTESITKLMNNSSGGMYYAAVKFGSGSYTVEISDESQNDAGSGGDAGDDYPNALEVQTGTNFSGLIGEFDEQDWYGFQIPGGHTLEKISLTPAVDATSMCLGFYGPDQDEITWEDSIDPGETETVRPTSEVSSGGKYCVAVKYGSGSYTIELSGTKQTVSVEEVD